MAHNFYYIDKEKGFEVTLYEGRSYMYMYNGIFRFACETKTGPNRIKWVWNTIFHIKVFIFKLMQSR